MASGFWYVDRGGARQGPIDESELHALLRNGTAAPDTLVWTEGMGGWQRADTLDALRSSAVPTLSSPPMSPGAGQLLGPALQSTASTWGLFGRTILVILGNALVIPAPWVNVAFWRYMTQNVMAPNGQFFRFEGRPGDIWYVFIAQGLLLWLGQVHNAAGIVTGPLSLALSFLIIRWAARSVWITDNSRRFNFVGGFWAFVGWFVLVALSFITIIGWAWVCVFYLRWFFRNLEGDMRFDFAGTGLGILWRTFAGLLACSLIIPIPWVLVWLQKWYASQVVAQNPITSHQSGVITRR